METVRYSIRCGIAVIALDNPPVNVLGFAERKGLLENVQRAASDPDARSIVLVGSERAFSGGADIQELAKAGVLQEPNLPAVIDAIESCPKLVIAAISGVCMGGGLELALAAHYRIASVTARLAFPEIKMGLVPGAGGTQRLPRAVGLDKSLDFMLKGDPVGAVEFRGTPLIDRLAESDLIGAAVDYAKKLTTGHAPLRQLRNLNIDSENAAALFAAARKRVKAAAIHYPAYDKIIDCVEAAATLPVDEGLRFERAGFLALRETNVHRALRYVFTAERECAKISDIPRDTKTRPVNRVAVVGAGTMGRGIAMNFLNVGLPVVLLDTNQEALDRGVAAIRGLYEGSIKRGRLSETEMRERLDLLTTTLHDSDVQDADLIIEAVFEDIVVKETVFRRLDQVARPGAILATNTSTLDVDRIASFTKRPDDVVGMHFFSPANVMKLLEVVRGEKTSNEVLATVLKLARTIRKTAVVARVCDGFIGNRMLEHYVRMAGLMVEEGAMPWQVDQALENWGMVMGPFRMGDLAGNDIGWAVRQRRYVEKPRVKYARIADRIYEMGRYGQKTGKGWYAYSDGDRTPIRDPDVDAIITDYRREKGMTPRTFSDEEIIERCIYALVNEGARILEDGTALRASDIDVVYLFGYGFPRFRGGPMRYADDMGLQNVVDRMREFERASNDPFWKPAPIIERLLKERQNFTF